MDFLDLRTILVSYTLSNLICTIVLFSLWLQNRTRFAGLNYFMLSFAVNLVGILLLALRGITSDFLSLLLGNGAIISAVLLLFIGLEKFFKRKFNQTHNYVLFGIYLILQAWFIYGSPNLQYRMILFSAMITIYCVQITWLLITIKEKKNRSLLIGLVVLSIIYWLSGIIRIGNEIISPVPTEFFTVGIFEAVLYLLFQTVYIVLTFFLFLLVNRRLVNDLEEDIVVRKKTEDALEFSQEKYLKAFQSSPNAVLITRMMDGKVVEANDRFISIFGYSREEIFSQSTLDLNLWVNPDERKEIVGLITNQGFIQDFEVHGRIKSGKVLTFLFTAELIKINNESCMLAHLMDITERKKIEAFLQLRLTLWEFASDHSTPELMQKVLDEVEILTESKIGFFHLMDTKKESLILQAWSTQTKDVFCKAEGEGMHYPVDQAGVWCDSVREKRSLIHNDYNSMPNRKGMPEGHATVVRELVVPIIRDGKVVAVLGIGNKPADYDQNDMDLVTNVANMAWEIILENQFEEKILELNTQLEKLAMTDELTRLSNRRAFFIRGSEEIGRAKRYKQPLSLIMLDIDRFKLINDSFGHEYGDMALKCLAKILMLKVREVDFVGRLGGEEFAILLPNTDHQHALILAERLRAAIEQESCLDNETKLTFTASFGVAELSEDTKKLDDLLRNADTAMYQAKNEGKNQVRLFGA